MTFELHQSVKM